MARHIEQERIDARELDEDEIQYLRDRNRLPKDYFEQPAKGLGTSPTIGTSGGIDDDDDEEEDYEEGWNNDQRRAELTKRKLSIEGKKDELIARLRRSDMDELEETDYSTLED